MAVSREAIFPAALVAGAIVAHAYITQPPHYQFFPSSFDARKAVRGDTHTGQMLICELDYMPDETEFYDCSPPPKAASPAAPKR